MEIFESFFGTENPHHIAIDCEGKQVPMIEKIESDLPKEFVSDKDVKAKDTPYAPALKAGDLTR